MTDDRASDADANLDLLRKENAKLARQVQRLEAQMRNVEDIRDTNVRALDRVRGDLESARAQAHDLLLNVLPQPIIDRLNAGEGLIADRFDDVAIVFSDFVGFTGISERLPVATLVASLNDLFSTFDAACAEFGVEKIKTIGDAYLAAAGLSVAPVGHVHAAADLALRMRAAVEAAGEPWHVRIGIHVGPAIAGVIGTTKFVYDLWGDAVNTASRLETTAPPDTIQVSAAVAEALDGAFDLAPRGSVELKGKGPTEAYLLIGRRPPTS